MSNVLSHTRLEFKLKIVKLEQKGQFTYNCMASKTHVSNVCWEKTWTKKHFKIYDYVYYYEVCVAT